MYEEEGIVAGIDRESSKNSCLPMLELETPLRGGQSATFTYRTQLTDVTQSCRFGDQGHRHHAIYRACVHPEYTLHRKLNTTPWEALVASATTQAMQK